MQCKLFSLLGKMDKVLVNYIAKEKKKGFSSEKIKNTLVKAGHNVQKVEEHLSHAFKEAETDKKKVLIVSIVIVILVLSVFFYFMSSPQNKVKKYANRGLDFYKEGKFEESIEQFNKAIEINPEISELYRGLGGAYLKHGDYEKAIENFEKALSINPNSSNTYNGLGEAHYQIGDYDKAIEYFNEAINIDSNYDKAYIGLGLTYYYSSRKYKEAEEKFNEALEINPNNFQAYTWLGLIYLDLGKNDISKIEEAKLIFEKSLGINKDYWQTYFGLGQYNYIKGNYNESLDFLSEVEVVYGFDFRSKLLQARVLTKLGEYEKAEEIFEQLNGYKESPYYCMLYIVKGMVELDKGDIESSQNNYDIALDVDSRCTRFAVTQELERRLKI